MFESILLVAIGIALLIYGAKFFVDGAASLARILRVPTLVVGLTVVALGTSAPELVVNVLAAIKDRGEIAFGTIVGSNISNILLMLGIVALIIPLKVKLSTVWKEIPFSLLAVLTLGVMANDIFLDENGFMVLSRGDGIILTFFFLIFLYYIYEISKAGRSVIIEQPEKHSYIKTTGMLIGGLVILLAGGNVTVDAAIKLAAILGISDGLIGLTIVAIGTSLPELAATAMAAYRKQVDMAVGTIVGSNIFNIFFVLGISSTIRPIVLNPVLNFDILILIVVTLILFASLFIGEKHTIKRWQGIVFISMYIVYLMFIISRG